ncbi:MAG: DUF3108 domain-containing protein [Kiritimatiellia bacterium]|nr:DUF3108 domain-containing protein [Kiritimatiellia bacterium]
MIILKGNFYLFVLAVLLTAPVFGAEEADWQPDLWFPVGERLTYKVYWGIFPVAETKVTSEWIEEDEQTLLAIRVTTKSYALLDAIYPIDDFIESVVDPDTFTPIRFSKRLSEGRYRLNEITTFNHQERIAHWKHLIKNDSKDFAIESDTRDLLSFMFFMRSQKFEPNRTYNYRLMADEKLYDLYIHTKNYVQLNLSKFGVVRSLYIQPEAKFQGFFVRVGRLRVWISDDERRLCVKAIAKAPVVGTIKLLLDKVEGSGNDFWVKCSTASDQ